MEWFASVISAVVFSLIVVTIVYFLAPKGWRTVAFNSVSGILLATVPLIEPLLGQFQIVPWGQVFDVKTAVLVTLFVNCLNVVLRSITNTPVGEAD